MATLSEIESQIGIPPRNKAHFDTVRDLINTDTAKRILLREWLVKSGIPHKSAVSAMNESLVKAYTVPAYLSSWRAKINPKWAVLNQAMDSFDDEIDGKDESSVKTLQETNGTNGHAANGEIPLDLTDKAAQMLAPVIQKLVESAVKGQLAQALTSVKIDLSPQAREEIKGLATNAAVFAAVEEMNKRLPPKRLEIFNATSGEVKDLGLQHENFPKLLRSIQAKDHKGRRLNVWISGPTGSGKTSAAEAAAKALGLPFGADGSLDADYKVIGFRNAQGEVIHTEFRKIFTNGGVYVADEIDNWHPSALLSLNSALANGWCSFPDGMLPRHPDCCIIACANTWGMGATNDYVGRTKLDAATLDRFNPKLDWPVDETLERAIAQEYGGLDGTSWHDVVTETRRKAKAQGLKVVISPRATITGISLLQAGFSEAEVTDLTLCAGLSPEQKRSLGFSS